jgi:hypothetical protein
VTPFFRQADPEWADDVLPGGDTLRRSGCTLTCMCILAVHLKTRPEVTPKAALKMGVDLDAFVNRKGTGPGNLLIVDRLAPELRLTAGRHIRRTLNGERFMRDELDKAMRQGCAILWVDHDSTKERGDDDGDHYLAALTVLDGAIVCADPITGRETRLSLALTAPPLSWGGTTACVACGPFGRVDIILSNPLHRYLMKRIISATGTRHLFLLALVGSLMATLAVLAADTEATQAYNPNIRGQDGRLVPSRISTAPQFGEMYIMDGTGESFTTPSDEVINSATLSLARGVRGDIGVDGVAGTVRITKPGLYTADFCATDGTGANTATVSIELFRKDGAGAAAEISPNIESRAVTLTAQPWIPLCGGGSFLVSPGEAGATGGVLLDARLTASTGNVTLKSFNLRVQKVAELDPASL